MGHEPLGLVLFFGDVSAARTGFAKLNDAHERMLTRVRQGVVPADAYHIEMCWATSALGATMLLTDDLTTLRVCLENSLCGAALEDEAVRAGLAVCFQGPFGWRTEEGYRYFSLETQMLQVRGLLALVEADTDASRATLREWLPSPVELLRIAEYEVGWFTMPVGANHPSLLCARLHGERLGNWAVTVEVADALLRIEAFRPLQRTEAHRLLGRAKAALGERAAACKAAVRAAAEAAAAKYVWIEMLSLRDLMKWCEPDAVEGVRGRLRAVSGQMAASGVELAELLGEGVL